MVADHHATHTELPAWRSVVAAMPVPAALVDRNGVMVAANRWIEVEPGQALVRPLAEAVSKGLVFGADGTTRWRVRPVDPDAGVFLATTEREDTGDHLIRRFYSTGDSLFVVYDQSGHVIESNQAWEKLLGYSHDEVFGLDSWTLLPPDDVRTRVEVEQSLRTRGRAEPTFHMRRADGTYRLVRWALHFDTAVGRCFGIGRDVTEEHRLAAELHRRATTDELTGLANRATFLEALSAALEEGHDPAVLFLDLDHFKVINDSLGHAAGDELLAALGARLNALAVSADSVCARQGGDEFVVLLADGSEERAIAAAEETLEALTLPFRIADRSLRLHMSIGISYATADHRDPDRILGEADTAAYEAKRQGRGRYVVFDRELRAAVDRRFEVEAALRRALDGDELEVHLQPIVRLPGGGVVGAEALVRWRTGRELLGPGAFLDVAEEAGLMPDLGRLVVDRAIEAGSELRRRGRPMYVTVNLTAAELVEPDVVDVIARSLARWELPARDLVVEITESTVISADRVLPTLHELRALGVRIALDDFGTGFSSLAHLRELPIDVVKIDRSFVWDLVDDEVTRAMTGSLLHLCDAMGLDVVCEGIETTDQAAVVERLGGTLGQGFLFHRPMPIDELLALVTRPTGSRVHDTSLH